jgi:hypothetical protein
LGSGAGEQRYTNAQRLAARQWHRYQIDVIGHEVTVWLNGAPATKFRRDPSETHRGNPPSVDPDSGYVGIQAHTGVVAFANIAIRASH